VPSYDEYVHAPPRLADGREPRLSLLPRFFQALGDDNGFGFSFCGSGLKPTTGVEGSRADRRVPALPPSP